MLPDSSAILEVVRQDGLIQRGPMVDCAVKQSQVLDRIGKPASLEADSTKLGGPAIYD